MGKKLVVMILFILIFVVGIVFGMSLTNMKDNNQPLDIPLLTKRCEYGGKTYASGDSFPDEDGCNSCSCEDGQIACTLMACE